MGPEGMPTSATLMGPPWEMNNESVGVQKETRFKRPRCVTLQT